LLGEKFYTITKMDISRYRFEVNVLHQPTGYWMTGCGKISHLR